MARSGDLDEICDEGETKMKLRREQGAHLLPTPAGRAGTVRRVLRGGTCFWYSVVGVLVACQLVAAYIYFFSAPSLHPVKSPPHVPPLVPTPTKRRLLEASLVDLCLLCHGAHRTRNHRATRSSQKHRHGHTRKRGQLGHHQAGWWSPRWPTHRGWGRRRGRAISCIRTWTWAMSAM